MNKLRGSGDTAVRGRVVYSESNSFDKTAILPFQNTFIKLFAIEGSQAKFEHELFLDEGEVVKEIPEEFFEVCEEGSVHVKAWSMEEPGICGNKVRGALVESKRVPDCKVWLTLVGTRKGKTAVFPEASEEEFVNNSRFYKSATTGELFVCQCQRQE
jgi:hypothetical protein